MKSFLTRSLSVPWSSFKSPTRDTYRNNRFSVNCHSVCLLVHHKLFPYFSNILIKFGRSVNISLYSSIATSAMFSIQVYLLAFSDPLLHTMRLLGAYWRYLETLLCVALVTMTPLDTDQNSSTSCKDSTPCHFHFGCWCPTRCKTQKYQK